MAKPKKCPLCGREMISVGNGPVWSCNGPHEESARAMQTEIQQDEERLRLKAALGVPAAAKSDESKTATKRIPVYPHRSRRFVGGGKQKPDGWICGHAAPRDCRNEGDIILCEACSAAFEAGAEVVQCEVPRSAMEGPL